LVVLGKALRQNRASKEYLEFPLEEIDSETSERTGPVGKSTLLGRWSSLLGGVRGGIQVTLGMVLIRGKSRREAMQKGNVVGEGPQRIRSLE